jgi:hypothetical protein
MTIELTDDEYGGLLVLMGFALAQSSNNRMLQNSFLITANAVGRNSPNFTAYKVVNVKERKEKRGE